MIQEKFSQPWQNKVNKQTSNSVQELFIIQYKDGT